jgi:predicted signal transduction protein with EAL and GGDEF domain
MILDTLPEYLKVDRYVVAGCHRCRERRALLESTAGLAAALCARVIAEGVEDEADLATVLASASTSCRASSSPVPCLSATSAAVWRLPSRRA